MNSEVAARVTAFLDAHHVMSLATGGPQGVHAVNLFYARHIYASHGFSLLWLSDPKTRHSAAIEADPKVSATIAPDYRDFNEIRGLQISAYAHRVTEDAERRRARDLLEARYAFLKALADHPSLNRASENAVLYRLVPRTIVMIDNTRGFGHKDTLEFESSN